MKVTLLALLVITVEPKVHVRIETELKSSMVTFIIIFGVVHVKFSA